MPRITDSLWILIQPALDVLRLVRAPVIFGADHRFYTMDTLQGVEDITVPYGRWKID
jgi:hypothetical protein